MSETTRDSSTGLLCPVCKVDLVMTERQNVEIDYCPKCRGVWLDRGELDKIIEKSVGQTREQPQANQPPAAAYGGYEGQGHGGHGGHGGYGKHGYRRKSWLSEIFD